jgi:hypothetical protein
MLDMTIMKSDLPDYVSVLKSVMAELSTLNQPAEDAFLNVGSSLGQASTLIRQVQNSFGELIEQLEGTEAQDIADGMGKASEQMAILAAGSHGSTAMLVRMGAVVKQIEARLAALNKVIGEVAGLAINGKIQAALIAAGGIDFTVFTAEIQRLSVLAYKTIEQTGQRLQALGKAIAEALTEERTFERDAATELTRVQERLADGLTVLMDQHRAAAAAVLQVEAHCRDTADHVAACMTKLQFNDTACQRIEHVREAMATIVDLTQAGGEDGIDTLAGAVCRLQALQLSRTAAEYREQVDALIRHLRDIADDATKVCTEAGAAVAQDNRARGGTRQDSFTATIERDIAVAAQLLSQETAGQERIKIVVQSVAASFTEMTRDLEAIHSIDSDMRVMGLNATFKCARLGVSGRALGVIAFELRSCSKRTEEISGQISDLLQSAIEMSKMLGTQEGNEAAQGFELERWMNNSSRALGALSQRLDSALDKLRGEGERVARLLAESADSIVIHHRMNDALTRASAKLDDFSDATGAGSADIEAMSERVRALVAGRYTMQSERLIHQIFADCFNEENHPSCDGEAATSNSIDDLLF